MKLKNTVIALILLASLGGVLYYLQKNPQSATPSDAESKKKLFSFQAEQVKEFTIEQPDQPSVTARRTAKADQWEIVVPAGASADSSAIQSLVNELPKLESTPLETQTPSSLAEYGLDKPLKTFKIQPAQGSPITLSIGKENPGATAKYAIVSSIPGLFLLETATTRDVVDKTLFDFRDKRALPISMDQAKKIELRFDASVKPASGARPSQIIVTKQSNGNWEMTDPAVRADYGNTGYFVTSLTIAVVKSVEEDQPKSLTVYGLDRPQLRVEITMPDGPHSLLVGKKKEAPKKPEAGAADQSQAGDLGYYAKNSEWPMVFTITPAFYDQLNQGLDNYRNRTLFDFETSNVRRLEVQGPEGEVRLDKKGEEWSKGGNAQAKVDASKVTSFLDSIHSLRIQEFTDDKPGRLAVYGLDKPLITVKVIFGEANREETVVFAFKNNKFYATRQGQPSVYELPSTEKESVQTKLKELSS